MEETIINQARLCGIMDSVPSFSHENHGRQFYRFVLGVPLIFWAQTVFGAIAAWKWG